jgi:hypothetical protein
MRSSVSAKIQKRRSVAARCKASAFIHEREDQKAAIRGRTLQSQCVHP